MLTLLHFMSSKVNFIWHTMLKIYNNCTYKSIWCYKNHSRKMVLRPCSGGTGVMAAIPISSSRCQWCVPRERKRVGWTVKVNGGCHVMAAPILNVPSKCSEKCFLNKVLTVKTAALTRKTTTAWKKQHDRWRSNPGIIPTICLMQGNSGKTKRHRYMRTQTDRQSHRHLHARPLIEWWAWVSLCFPRFCQMKNRIKNASEQWECECRIKIWAD